MPRLGRIRTLLGPSDRSRQGQGRLFHERGKIAMFHRPLQPQSVMQDWSPSGLRIVPHLQWGSHLAHFFGTGDDLRDVLVPYFKAGLENNERCLWVTGPAFNLEQARSALRAAVSDLDERERAGQIEIVNGEEWYAAGEKLAPDFLVRGLVRREQDALGIGYAGLRTNGNCAWVSQDQWPDFLQYEGLVQSTVRGRRMICMCSYCTDQLDGSHLEVMERHDLTVPSALRSPPRGRPNTATSGATSAVKVARDEQLETLERQKRTFDLAMTASHMGTWRYTLADNICVYDENAQRLYGLTNSRFLHNEEGVKSKFHADDLELMWSRVAKALDPEGDGHYDVEYRVKQLDGSWRWLSAWGLVEFEGEGPGRKPVAVAGASRDLTERKQAEDLQRLLLNELNHRVKNTLATIQALTYQTLRSARDLPSAREALDRRIRSMAQAHDLLTLRAWTGANLTDVVRRALDAFAPAQVNMSGTAIDVSPKHALALSLALHELATNAAKYGALSHPEGRVTVQRGVREGMLHLGWEESGGPPVAPPNRKGFGSRLLEELVARDLGGNTKLNYDVSGVRCSITARL
jgi:two-component sensor histidine kinase/PAS domain-containing protein